MIKYRNIVKESVVDGQGLRVVVFLQGCPRHCVGCHNSDLIPSIGGIEIDENKMADLILNEITPLHKGITFTGGDPLMQHSELLKVIMAIIKKNASLDFWVYTGYKFEEVKDLPVMSLIDVLVDGPFEIDKKDLGLTFKGSLNQRIIDVVKTRKNNKIVLKEI